MTCSSLHVADRVRLSPPVSAEPSTGNVRTDLERSPVEISILCPLPQRAIVLMSVRRIHGLARRANVAGWLFVVAVLVLAEGAVRLFELSNSVPAPSAALAAFVDGMLSGTLSGELGTTLQSYVQGFAIAVAVGVPLGVAIGSSRAIEDATAVVIEFLRPIPAVALIPLAILVLGLGTPMLRFVIAYAAVWPILVHTIYGVRGVDRMLYDVAATAGVKGASRIVRVTVPSALPSIATGIRVSASIALVVCVTAEFFVGTSGIGAYMQAQQVAYQLPELYAAAALTGLFGIAIDMTLKTGERRALFWVGEERAEHQ
jgi:ABC-type nitrate/sulfonate/bicarbonate transport system permease component